MYKEIGGKVDYSLPPIYLTTNSDGFGNCVGSLGSLLLSLDRQPLNRDCLYVSEIDTTIRLLACILLRLAFPTESLIDAHIPNRQNFATLVLSLPLPFRENALDVLRNASPTEHPTD
jgi:hypothetical protein